MTNQTIVVKAINGVATDAFTVDSIEEGLEFVRKFAVSLDAKNDDDLENFYEFLDLTDMDNQVGYSVISLDL